MKTALIITFYLMGISAFAQDEISFANTKISNDAILIKTVKVFDCKTDVPAGSVLKTETVKKGKDKTYTITTEKKITNPEKILVEKEIKIKMTGFGGKASVFSKKDKPGRLFVDFWLNPKKEIPINTNIKVISRKLKCPADLENIRSTDYEETSIERKTTKKEIYYLFRIEKEDYKKWNTKQNKNSAPDWFVHTDKIIEIHNKSKNIEYALVDKYDRDIIYELKLENRQVFTVINKGLDLGPLTLPFKYRFGHTKNDIEVNQEFKADINIGAFAGFKIANLSFRTEQEKSLALPKNSLSIGSFLSLAAVELDKSNTTSGEVPLAEEEKASIGTLSVGLGIILNLSDLNIGIFGGIESGFGPEAKNWNFNNKPWLGLGLGYNLNGFIKKKE